MRLLSALAAVASIALLAPAGAHAQAAPVLNVAVVVRVDSPPLLTSNGQPAAGNEGLLASAESALRDLAHIRVPFAVSASPVWVDEVLAAGSTRVYAALLALATRHPLLRVPYAHVLLPHEPDRTAIGRELRRGEDGLQRSLQTASQPILDPPGLAASNGVLAASRASGVRAMLAPAAIVGDEPVSDGGVTLVPAVDLPAGNPGTTLADRFGSRGHIALLARPTSSLIPALAADKRMRIVNISDLIGRPINETVDFDPVAPPPESYRGALAHARSAVGGFMSYTLPGNQTSNLLSVLLARAASTADWQRDWQRGTTRALAVAELADAEHAFVSASDGSVTLTSRSGAVPVTLENGAQYPVRVRVLVTSPKLAFPAGDSRLVTIAPHGMTITFVAEARSTGSFPMDVALESPDGSVKFTGGHVVVRSTAANILALLLTGSGLLFLIAWSSRDIIRRAIVRRSR